MGRSHREIIMDRRITQFIYRYSLRDQIRVLLLTLLFFPILYLSLNCPKPSLTGQSMAPKPVAFWAWNGSQSNSFCCSAACFC